MKHRERFCFEVSDKMKEHHVYAMEISSWLDFKTKDLVPPHVMNFRLVDVHGYAVKLADGFTLLDKTMVLDSLPMKILTSLYGMLK